MEMLADGCPMPAEANHYEKLKIPLTVYGKNLTIREFFFSRSNFLGVKASARWRQATERRGQSSAPWD
jgi:hypothetical protein